jgi:DNA-binding beta-propeller fold protein YncE
MVVLLAAVTLLVFSTPAAAQRVAVSYSPFPFTASTDLINLTTGTVESREPRSLSERPVFTSDGRFLLLRFSPVLEVRDLATGFRTSIDTAFQPRRGHPRRLAVYGLMTGNIARLDPTGLHPVASCAGDSRDVELTVDGSRVFVLCASGNVESIDEASGMRLSVVAAGASALRGLGVNADGSQVLVARDRPGGGTELVLCDVATGNEIIATPIPGPLPPPPFTGPGTGRIVAVTPNREAVVVTNVWFYDPNPGPLMAFYRTQVLELATLTPQRELSVPFNPVAMAISPDGSRAFVASNLTVSQPAGRIQDLDLRTGQPTVAMTVANVNALGAAFPPLPPTPNATVIGGRVTIAWTLLAHSPPADRFVIHAGSRSGASDLGRIEVGGGVTSFSVASVPPGRYFVRVTASNFTGTSSPSSEVIIDVR